MKSETHSTKEKKIPSPSSCTEMKKRPSQSRSSSFCEEKDSHVLTFLPLPAENIVDISPEVENILCETLLLHLQKHVKAHRNTETVKEDKDEGEGNSNNRAAFLGTPSVSSSTADLNDSAQESLAPYLRHSCAAALEQWVHQSFPPPGPASDLSDCHYHRSQGCDNSRTTPTSNNNNHPSRRHQALYQRFHQCLARVAMQASLHHSSTSTTSPSSLFCHESFLCKLLVTLPQIFEDPLFWRPSSSSPSAILPAEQTLHEKMAPGDPRRLDCTSGGNPTESHGDAPPALSFPSMSGGEIFCILLSAVLSPFSSACAAASSLSDWGLRCDEPDTSPWGNCAPSTEGKCGAEISATSLSSSPARTAHDLSRPPPLPPRSSGRHGGEKEEEWARKRVAGEGRLGGGEMNVDRIPGEMAELAELYLLLSSGPWATQAPSKWGKNPVMTSTAVIPESKTHSACHSSKRKRNHHTQAAGSEEEGDAFECSSQTGNTTLSSCLAEPRESHVKWSPKSSERMLLFMMLRGITQLLQRQLLRLHDENEAMKLQPRFSHMEEGWKKRASLPKPLPLSSDSSSFASRASTPQDTTTVSGENREKYEGNEGGATSSTTTVHGSMTEKEDKENAKSSPILQIIQQVICRADVRSMSEGAGKSNRGRDDDGNRSVPSADVAHYSGANGDPIENLAKDHLWSAAQYREAIQDALHLYFRSISCSSFTLSTSLLAPAGTATGTLTRPASLSREVSSSAAAYHSTSSSGGTAPKEATMVGENEVESSQGNLLQEGEKTKTRSHKRRREEQEDEEKEEEEEAGKREAEQTNSGQESAKKESQSQEQISVSLRTETSPEEQARRSNSARSSGSIMLLGDASTESTTTTLVPEKMDKKKDELVAESLQALDAFNKEQDAKEEWRDRRSVVRKERLPNHTQLIETLRTLCSTTSHAPEDIEEYSGSEDDEENNKKGPDSAHMGSSSKSSRSTPTSTSDGAIPSHRILSHNDRGSSPNSTSHSNSFGMANKSSVALNTSPSSGRLWKRQHRQGTSFPSLSTPPDFSVETLYPSPAAPSGPLPRPPLASSSSYSSSSVSTFSLLNLARSTRRNKCQPFSPEEDAAILQGVTRFPGCTPTDFRHIFSLFPDVWHPVRTPLHLYDHWRQTLKYRVQLEMNL